MRGDADYYRSGADYYRSGIVRLVVGVTGHRDLVDAEIPRIREEVEAFLTELRKRFPDRPLMMLSSLAEGADQLAAEAALELGVELTVILPMPRDLYVTDFVEPRVLARFEELCGRAREVLELPILQGASSREIRVPGEHRDRQYAQLGVFLCAHSHILLALWDGRYSESTGGTAQVVNFHHHDVMAGYSSVLDLNQQILADDDSDLVYHIVVSRRGAEEDEPPDLRPLSALWLTTDEHEPRTGDIPEKYVNIFERTSEFNRDARVHAGRIASQSFPLAAEAERLPPSLGRIDAMFRAADWLAIRYQRKFLRALKASLALLFLMATTFLFYSDVAASQYLMLAFGVCLGLAFAVQTIASRGGWHAKYLEYRTLAEGLRVQFYWAAAGVTSQSVTKYAHDNFLQRQDVQLGWIRNVMRLTGVACDVEPSRDPEGLAFAIREWIGDEAGGGQLRYYRKKAAEHQEHNEALQRIGNGVSLAVFVLIATAVLAPSDQLRSVVFVALGLILLTVGVREAYVFRIAGNEVIRQYEFMHRIFHNAHKRLAAAATDADRRRILRVLGEAALDEHAEWILLHRERPLSKNQLWRMEG